MVALRERRSRPSYAEIHQGLETFSDDEDGVGDQAGGSGSGSVEEREEDGRESVSSGASSEFNPEEDELEQDEEDELEQDEEDENDEAEDEGEGEDEDEDEKESLNSIDDNVVDATPARRQALGRSARDRISSSALPEPAERGQYLPSEYRQLLRASSSKLAKPAAPDGERNEKLRGQRRRKEARLEYFPSGPITPFTSTLNAKPELGKKSDVVLVMDQGDRKDWKRKRQEWAYRLASRTPMLAPWQTWRGASWWPEMYRNSKDKGKGKEKAVDVPIEVDGQELGEADGTLRDEGWTVRDEGWILRDDVRLDLDDTGCLKVKSLEILSAEQAMPFLPTPSNLEGNPWITCHMGPRDDLTPVQFQIFDSRPLAGKVGHVLFAGAPVWGLDWCPYPEHQRAGETSPQYVAISTLPHKDFRAVIGQRCADTLPGSIQIWSLTGDSTTCAADSQADTEAPQTGPPTSNSEVRCELILCLDGGPVTQLKWMPLGAWDDANERGGAQGLPKLGIISAVQLNGTVSFYPIPHPSVLRRRSKGKRKLDEPIYLRLRDPLLKLQVEDANCTCLDWISGSRVAVGLSNGCFAVWAVHDALVEGHGHDAIPAVYGSAAFSSIRSICAARTPPFGPDGEPLYGEDPTYLILSSYDGSTTLVDTRDPSFPIRLNMSRVPAMVSGWLIQTSAPLYADVEYVVQMKQIRDEDATRHYALAVHRGPLWDLCTSDYHTMVASAGSDGSVQIANVRAGFYRRRRTPVEFQRLFEVDYDVHTGEYRMVDNFMPEEISLEDAVNRNLSKRRPANSLDPRSIKTANWAPEAGVHVVQWQNGAGIGRAGWLASGTASGLVRLEEIS